MAAAIRRPDDNPNAHMGELLAHIQGTAFVRVRGGEVEDLRFTIFRFTIVFGDLRIW